jgi:hypothetical protein
VIFLKDRDYPQFAEKLHKVFQASIPPAFHGFPTRFHPNEAYGGVMCPTTEAGKGKHHVQITTVARFLEEHLGFSDCPDDDFSWLVSPEQRLLEFTSGEVFFDPSGDLTEKRNRFSYFPDSVWKYRLSYVLESLGWSIDVTAMCGNRGDMISAQINAVRSVERVMKLTFLLNKRYGPGSPKWLHREFGKLPVMARDIEGHLRNALSAETGAQASSLITRAVREVCCSLRAFDSFASLPDILPIVRCRGMECLDTHRIAMTVLKSIDGPLGDLLIDGAPIGAVDQWVTHEDITMWPKYMKALSAFYDRQRNCVIG